MKRLCLIAVVLAVFAVFIAGGIAPARATNVALSADVATNSVYGSNGPGLAVDGNATTNWSATSYGTTSLPFWLTVDLGSVYNIATIVLKGYDDPAYSAESYQNYRLYVAGADGDWTLRATDTLVDAATGYFDTIALGGMPIRYVKYEVYGGTHWAHLFELEANTSPVPVPAPLLLLAPGLMGLTVVKRRIFG